MDIQLWTLANDLFSPNVIKRLICDFPRSS